ncbi:MAG: hypothetical protein H0W33_03745 [Gammaproteobacteria bacterium]|nr:hypothetical protein [Gammaproteobacteria bacterium]
MRASFWSMGFAVLLLTGCGGGSSGGGRQEPPPDPDPPPAGDGEATVSGQVTFDRVPHNAITNGLDYASTVEAPVRGAVVEAIDAAGGTNVLASTQTDAQGNYSLAVPADTDLFIRVKAQALRTGTPSWDFAVVDNTSGDALYVLDGAAFDSGTAATARNLHAASGWGGASYTGARAAAPFSILDAVYESFTLVLDADPSAGFPPLELNWSPNNRPVSPFDADDGDIVTSSFRFSGGVGEIFILGAADSDTDEFDRHVVAHEWGHYFEYEFSRSDSIGGPHGLGDYLDPRVAFGEGFGNAFSGMALDDPVYRDSMGEFQTDGFFINVEDNDSPNSGWYSEFSIHSILYDLFDAASDGIDAVTLGFGPIYDVLTEEQRMTDALTTIFTFIPPLKDANPADAANIDALVAAQDIAAVTIDEFGSTETNGAGNSDDVLPVYTLIATDGVPVEICSLGGGENPPRDYGSVNRLSNARFLRFNVDVQRTYLFTATGPSGSDPDLVLHQMGIIAVSDEPPPGPESFSRLLAQGDYVLEVYEFTNITDMPRGRTCFDVSIT